MKLLPSLVIAVTLYGLSFQVKAQVVLGEATTLGLSFDNDFYFMTDYYYTNGISLETHLPKTIKLFSKQDRVQQYFGLEQKIYTPTRYNQDTISFDRPFVSSLTFQYKATHLRTNDQLRITHGIEIGLQGENSGGRTVQNKVHDLLPTSKVINDWEYQLSTDILANYQLEIEKGLWQNQHIMINGITTFMAGTPQLSTSLGVHMRLGKLFDRFKYEDIGTNDWTLFFYAKPMMQIRAYDTLLQGGFFSKNDDYTLAEIHHLNYNLRTGIYASYFNWTVDFSVVYESALAPGLTSHQWASLRFSYAIN